MSEQFSSIVLAQQGEKLLACIHCGLCLEACPTYVITGDENDGPRGRLYLMRAVAEGRLENTSDAFRTHIDRCLGCRACEQVCPAGVEYGQLLEASREELSRAQPKSDFTDKVLRFVLKHVWLSRTRLRLFFGSARVFRDLGLPRFLLKTGLARLFSQRAHFALALLENSRTIFHTSGKSVPSASQTDGQSPPVLLFAGCVGGGLFARVNRATERVLFANGFKVSAPEDQVCCGALHAHAGDLDGARELARKNIAAFKSGEPIVTNAGGCGAMLASYGHLLANDASVAEAAAQFSSRVRDVSQQLQTVEAEAAPLNKKARSVPDTTNGRCVTYDTSCHLLYGQHAGDASQQMLSAVVGPNFVPLEGSERCCGAAGIYNMLQPEMSGRVLQEKLDHVRETKAQILATGNPGCQMQIGAGAQLAGIKLQVCHPIELIDEAYAQAGVYGDGE
ncbi:MAG: 4Fe-4S dicluster domain-containing protein [Acidobacteria bacterium]|nr:4Fe-4S dicluster domain-containing protein [Acidobacteriota bacterium]